MGIDEIGYCGLHCGGCLLREGVEADPAEFRKAQRQVEFRTTAEALRALSYLKVLAGCPVCLEISGPSILMRCPKNCRQGGGNPACDIRRCCQRQDRNGCWECPAAEGCELIQSLIPAHGSEHLDNIAIIRSAGVNGFLAYCRNRRRQEDPGSKA